MVKRYLAALLLVPLVDALLLVVVGDVIGWLVTVLLVVLTGLVGMLLVQAEGRHTLRRLDERVRAGELPTDELLDGGLLIAAGAFLLTPGLVTDTIGFLFAVPLTRYPIREAGKRWLIYPYLERKTEGLLSGEIYTEGFPGDGDTGGFPGGGFAGDGADTYDVDDDAYHIEFEDDE